MQKIDLSVDIDRPLTAWLYAEWYVKSRDHYEGEVILPAQVFVSLDAVFEVHEAPHLPLKTLDQSWIDTQSYLTAACKLLGRGNPGRLVSAQDRKKVFAALGEPPGPAWPLYFLTVGEFPEEEIVYIGKTNARTHRFSSGHRAITALHGPEYRGRRTRLYLATVTLLSDEDNYVPLEWLHPKTLRDSIWSDLEAQLIFHFQPELNIGLKKSDRSKRPVFISFHNYSGTRSFDGEGILPRREVAESEWDEVHA
jgi:hypothetical protein